MSLNPPNTHATLFRVYRGLLASYVAVVLLAFGIVYACSLSFVYVEGDDASTIAFHVLGRHPSVQRPYSPYHGMMDVILGLLPAREPILRVFAMGMTSLAAVVFVILTLSVVFSWLGDFPDARKRIVAIVILLASPEFFYLGMIYTPSFVAMCLVLTAHLLLMRAATSGISPAPQTKRRILIVLSIILFGLGTACRWDVGAYAIVIFADLATLSVGVAGVSRLQALQAKQLLFSVCWLLLAATAAIAAIAASGYGVTQLFQVFHLAEDEISASHSWLSTMGSFQTLFTPAFLLLGIVGFRQLVLTRSRLAFIVAIGMVPVLPYLLSREPKMVMPAVPVMVLCVVEGFDMIWFPRRLRQSAAIRRLIIGLLLVGPWLVGIRANSPDTAWGPGFDVKTYGRQTRIDSAKALAVGTVDQHRISVGGMNLTDGGGLAIPTPEGPRPLGGHAAVLLGGGWRSLVNKLNDERSNVVRQAIIRGDPILQDNRNSYLLVQLVRMGFITSDPRDGNPSQAFSERIFRNGRDQQVRIIYQTAHIPLSERNQIESLASTSGAETVIFFSNYSSALRKLCAFAPYAVEPLGAFSALINVHLFRAASVQHDRPS
jgi:hypothetical protein